MRFLKGYCHRYRNVANACGSTQFHHRPGSRQQIQLLFLLDGCGAGEVFGGGEQCLFRSDAGLDREQAQVAEIRVGAGCGRGGCFGWVGGGSDHGVSPDLDETDTVRD